MLITRCDAAPATTCVVFGDWSSYRMLTYLSESFSRMVFVHLGTLDHELVEAERPDVVLDLVDESRADRRSGGRRGADRARGGGPQAVAGPEPMPHLATCGARSPRTPQRRPPHCLRASVEVSASTLAADVAARARTRSSRARTAGCTSAATPTTCILQHTGRLRFDLRKLEDWRHVLETSLSHGWPPRDPLLFLGPAEHARRLPRAPARLGRAGRRAAGPAAARHLRETGSKARIIYPLEELVAHKEHDLVYIKTDTHWNELGRSSRTSC